MRFILLGIGILLFGILFSLNSSEMGAWALLIGVIGLAFLIYGSFKDFWNNIYKEK